MDVSHLGLGSVACVCYVAFTLCCVRRRLLSRQITPGQYSSTRRGFIGGSGEEKRNRGTMKKKKGQGVGGLCLLFRP